MVQPRRGVELVGESNPSPDQNMLSESPGKKKDKPPLPRDRPPAPPPDSAASEVDGRPSLPSPTKHPINPKALSPTESSGTPSHVKFTDAKPYLQGTLSKRGKEKTKNDKATSPIESSNNAGISSNPRSGSISLNDLTKGIGALRSVKMPSNPVETESGDSAHNNEQKGGRLVPRRPLQPKLDQARPVRPTGIIEDEAVEGSEKAEVEEQKPVPAPRRNTRRPNGSAVNVQPDAQKRPLPPPKKPSMMVGEPKVFGNKPFIPGKKPQLSRMAKKTAVKQIKIDASSLKPELIPVAEELQNLYRSACDIITLTDARESENIKQKSEDCVSIATALLDRLSAYRDSLGPVTRMKVIKHITSLEECSNELTSLSAGLSHSPNAVELTRLSKMIISIIDVIETLSNCLSSL